MSGESTPVNNESTPAQAPAGSWKLPDGIEDHIESGTIRDGSFLFPSKKDFLSF